MRNACTAVLLVAALLSASATSTARAGETDLQEFTQIARGRYLATASDCKSCHTIPGGAQH